jgi:hypothetical protein
MARKSPESVGSRLRKEVLELYELSPVERVLLDAAGPIADALERINGEVAAAELTATGSTGQRVAEPLLREQREHAARLAAILEAIRIPHRDEVEGQSSTSKAAQRAAQVRWARQKAGGA